MVLNKQIKNKSTLTSDYGILIIQRIVVIQDVRHSYDHKSQNDEDHPDPFEPLNSSTEHSD